MLFYPFTFANGKTAKNRFFKSAMEEQLAKQNQPTMPLVQLYDTWARGGAGVLVTGNVMVAENGKGSINDVVLTDERSLPTLQQWAKAGTQNDTLLIMQINHAGKQSPKVLSPTPVAPSAVALQGMDGFINPPRALTETEINTLIEQFATTAKIAEKAGFSGVQIHAAHGYLISQFLSPHHNRREDKWGGSLENRMRFLVEIYHAIRAAVQPEFLVGLKLNSADFQKGGFTEQDSLETIQALADTGIDLIEISGGTYESGVAKAPQKASTIAREAFFIDFAEKVRKLVKTPLMVTGGFRTVEGMNQALQSQACDVIGIARIMAIEPDVPKYLLAGKNGLQSVHPIKTGIKKVDSLGIMEVLWYTQQLKRMGKAKEPKPHESGLWAFIKSILRSGWGTYATQRNRIKS